MKKLLKGQILFSFALAVVLLILLISDLGYNYQARLVPMLVVVPSLILAVAQFVIEIRRALQGKVTIEGKTLAEKESALAAIAAAQSKAKAERGLVSVSAVETTAAGIGGMVAAMPRAKVGTVPMQAITPEKDGKKEKEKLSEAERQKKEVIAFGWIIGIVLMIALFGFKVGLPISIFAFIKVFGRESWKLSIGYTVSLWLVVYLVFVMFMHAVLYDGMILDALGF